MSAEVIRLKEMRTWLGDLSVGTKVTEIELGEWG